jgi:hypothetical protein
VLLAHLLDQPVLLQLLSQVLLLSKFLLLRLIQLTNVDESLSDLGRPGPVAIPFLNALYQPLLIVPALLLVQVALFSVEIKTQRVVGDVVVVAELMVWFQLDWLTLCGT